MNKKLKISIIIPVYNVEPYIAECVESVMRQTYTGPLECILIDDCGTDKSIAVVEQLIAEYKGPIQFRILHHEHNRGLSAARNTGTDAATGDYIYYLDSDDYISDDCMEVLAQPLQEYEYDMVVGGMETFGTSRTIPPLVKQTGSVLSNKEIFEVWYGSKPLYAMACNRLVKRNLFDLYDMSFLEGQLHEDELWTYKCCLVLESLYIQNQITYYYRMRENSIMGKRNQNISKRAQSHYASVEYVLSHPAKVDIDLQNNAVRYFAGMYLSMSIRLFHNSWHQYRELRSRIDYHPLQLWKQGKLSLQDVKHQLHYALPPFMGYLYLKIRKLKQTIL